MLKEMPFIVFGNKNLILTSAVQWLLYDPLGRRHLIHLNATSKDLNHFNVRTLKEFKNYKNIVPILSKDYRAKQVHENIVSLSRYVIHKFQFCFCPCVIGSTACFTSK